MEKIGSLLNQEYGVDLRSFRIGDAGDVGVGLSLEEAHRELTGVVHGALKGGAVPFVIGGGNDQSYANASALLSLLGTGENAVVCNVDAHLDVRPLKKGAAHSGSPFRQLLEDKRFKESGSMFCEFAAQGSQCSGEHVQFVRERSGKVVFLAEMRPPNKTVGELFGAVVSEMQTSHLFLSFDLDAVASCDAPAVSCPAVVGPSADEAQTIMRIAGEQTHLRLVDLSEFSPAVASPNEAYRTGRLVAMMFYYLLLGMARARGYTLGCQEPPC